MQTLHWQKSSYSGDSSNCVYVAASVTGTLHLRESDQPDVILTTTAPGLHTFICALKERKWDAA
ncbi:DUF397 domain-containing protein [Streptomyces sp. ID05-39B]|uniref:DUF397 domain-containing protein n=1 Tax=Streptomyces sp. ID05-39B TaxID=3028664 RepID=UPI0029B20BA4|nr:DUF397 domain-containing protein [Streptomyces sp. ID05-39B]MDX3532210.1 DUF397 domain-containing protein [Streptomyces sp. ID05-39B]